MMAVPNRRLSEVVLAVLLAVPLLTVGLTLSRAPSHVTQLTIRNPAEYRMNVHLAAGSDRPTMPVGSVDRGTYLTVDEVLDMGGTWVFHFDYGGVRAAEVSLTRAELAAASWTVTVPDSVAGPLDAAGLDPTPRPSPDDPQIL
jgi:hypothetical protein